MNFSLTSILAVLSHALPPFLPLILSLVAALLTVQLIARLRGYRTGSHHCRPAGAAALLAGITSLWWVPMLSSSRLEFVTTATDWAALITVALGIVLASWLFLHPLSYLIRRPRHSRSVS
ncbi:hypothetical protein R5M92_08195 [Halomonas sp. Bachu 37]|uniref:hypothetical protein n=1 Tax=Halomonas kashgarensis TaxID=3084920 RepID=UPI0032166093